MALSNLLFAIFNDNFGLIRFYMSVGINTKALNDSHFIFFLFVRPYFHITIDDARNNNNISDNEYTIQSWRLDICCNNNNNNNNNNKKKKKKKKTIQTSALLRSSRILRIILETKRFAVTQTPVKKTVT